MPDHLPDRVHSLLHQEALTWVATLMTSERKAQYTVLAEDEQGTRMVLKYRDPSRGPLPDSSFYNRHSQRYLPRVQVARCDYVIMTYHEGQRLRQRLSTGTLGRRAREELVDALLHPPKANEPADPLVVGSALMRNLGRLFDSGPIDVPAPTGLRRLLRRHGSRLLRILVSPAVLGPALEAVRGAGAVYQHGDLHLNNVLIGSDGNVVIVDWEDAFVGVPVCDWLYFWPQYLGLVGRDDGLFDQFRARAGIEWPTQLRTFDQLLPLYNWAVQQNPRFSMTPLRP